MLTKSPANSLFSKFRPVEVKAGQPRPKIQNKILSLKKLRFDHKKSLTPALSKPGLSALFWSTVLSGAQFFLAHFLCPKPQTAIWAVLADVLDFRAEKDRKRRNLGDQADATLTHLKALILIHNNNTSKIKNGACHQPGPACRPVSAVDRRPGERNFFSELDQEKDRGSLSQAWGGGRWDRGGRLGA